MKIKFSNNMGSKYHTKFISTKVQPSSHIQANHVQTPSTKFVKVEKESMIHITLAMSTPKVKTCNKELSKCKEHSGQEIKHELTFV